MIISSAGIFWSASAITENTKKYARIPATQNGSEMYMADPENNEGRFCCLSKGAEAGEPPFSVQSCLQIPAGLSQDGCRDLFLREREELNRKKRIKESRGDQK